MNSEDVIRIYRKLEAEGIQIWIDGGWCVDALLGEQTRAHPDLDIAVNRSDNDRLKASFSAQDFAEQKRDDSTEWNYVLEDREGHLVDVHVFEFDEAGNNIYGIKYPMDSLTGEGVIDGQKVRCISPEWMFKFKTAYAPGIKDVEDVHALATKFKFTVPETHR
jgi:lincosamide nucleotidyltransferase A/C/D/E